MNQRWLTRLAGLLAMLIMGHPPLWAESANERAYALFAEGQQRQGDGRYAEAVQAYERSLREDSQQADTWSRLGFCYAQLKQPRKATQCYRRAILINPKLSQARVSLAEAYLRRGKTDLAMRQYETLARWDPQAAQTLKAKLDSTQQVR